MLEQIKSYYENYSEDGRLFRDKAHLTEYLTTILYFDKLFPKNSKVLDACSGTGRYSFYLADKGHLVTACDLVEHNINIIKANPNSSKLDEIGICNVIDLSHFKDNTFDIVLCMGALYHLVTNQERSQAISECVRVCKSGGIVVLSYITKVGAIITGLRNGIHSIEKKLRILDGTDDGIFRCVFPSEIETLANELNLQKVCNIGTDGMSQFMEDKINSLCDREFKIYTDYIYRTCEDESIIGTSLHGLYFARKV